MLQASDTLNLTAEDKSIDQVFSNFDINKDGVLAWEEIWAAMEPLRVTVEWKWKMTEGMQA